MLELFAILILMLKLAPLLYFRCSCYQYILLFSFTRYNLESRSVIFFCISHYYLRLFLTFLNFQVNDTIVVDITTGKMTDFVRFDQGNLCMVTGGRNMGRVGVVGHREKHPGSFDIVHIKDAAGHSFATR